MANTRDLFNQLMNPSTPMDQKQASLVQASQSKQSILPTLSDDKAFKLGGAAMTGLGQKAMETQVEADLLNLAPAGIIAKYGQEQGTALLASKYQGIDRFNAADNATRDMTQAAGDFINQVISGFGNAVGGVATLAGGAISDDLGVNMAAGMSRFDQAMRDMRSDASNASARVLDTKSDLRGADTAAQYQEDIANGRSNFMAGFDRLSSDFTGGLGDVVSDPTAFGDLAAQGVGSMAAIPAIAAGLTAATPGALAGSTVAATAGILGASKKAVKVGRAIEAALAPTAAIAAVEGGATYQQTANKVAGTSFEELEATSQEYRDLVATGLSPAAARSQLAGETAMLAAGIQAPASILAGAVVSKFAGAPAASRSMKEGLRNVGKEFMEEAAQSGSSQLAQNTALAANVDPNTDILEGVGSAAGQGAIAGLATAGAIQTPGVVANATSGVGSLLDEQVAKLKTKNDKASPVSDEVVSEAAANVQAAAPEVQAAVADNPELSQLVTDITESAINLDGEAVFGDETLPPVVRNAAKGQASQIGFLQALAKASTDTNLPELDRAIAMGAAKTIAGQLNDFLTGVNDQLVDLDNDHPVKKFVSTINEMNNAFNASPAQAAATKAAEATVEAAVNANPVTENASDAAVAAHLAASEVAPQKTTAEGVDTILKMATAGKIQLTEEQRFNLQMLSKLHQNAKEYDAAMVEGGSQSAESAVSMQIKTGTSGTDGSMSVIQHAQGIREALRRGDMEDAKSRLEDLGMFAQHMQNKVAAINSHMEQDKPTFQSAPSYQKLVGTRGNRQFVDSGRNKQGVTPSSETSVRHAQMVNAEANFVTKSYNSLAEVFDTLGLAPMEKVELDSRLRGNAAQVAADFSAGSRTAGKVAPAAQPAPAAKKPAPAPVQQAAPAPVVEPMDDAAKSAWIRAIAGMDDATISRRINALTVDLLTADNPRKAFALEALTEERTRRAEAVTETVEDEAPVAVAEPVEEVQEEAAPVEEAVETEEVNTDLTVASENPLATAYPSLVGGENNIFVTSYKLPMNPISNLDGVTTPISQVYSQIKEQVEDQSSIRAFQEILKDFPGVLNYLNNQLGDVLKKKRNGKTLREVALEGDVKTLTYYPEARSAALAEVKGDQITMNTELVAKAYLASLSWLMNGMNFIGATDVERIARAFRIDESEVTPVHMEALSNGVTRLQAIDALSQRIMQYWGVTPNRNAIDGYTKGIAQAMAGNMIDAMTNMTFPLTDENGNVVDTPVLVKTKLDLPGDDVVKQLDVFTPISLANTPLANHRSLMDKLVLANPEAVVYMGNNIPPAARTQMHNAQVQNTPEQIKMIENQNATSYYLNPQTLSVYESMGVDALIDLFGEGQLNAGVMNKNDYAARDGRNAAISSAWDMTKEVIFNMTNEAEDQGIEVTALPVHYAHNITSVGRAQQLGRYNPQSSKLMRTLLLPTVSKPLDLSKPGQDYTAFMLGLGQSLGVKVHNFGPDVTEAKVMEMVNGKYADVIEILRGHQNGAQITSDNLATFKRVLGTPTFESFQGLVEYARFLNTEDKTNYITQLYLEADGMSNGPFNSIAMLSTGLFTEDQLSNMAKCGLYFGNNADGNVSWVKRVEDPIDLYETVSKRTKAHMDQRIKGIAEQASSSKKSEAASANKYWNLQNHMNRLMGLLLDDAILVEKEDGSTELMTKRGISKNPTTVTTYGSGKAGIANKVANAMLENLYRRISDALVAHEADSSLTLAQAMFPGDPEADKKLNDLDAAMKALTSQKAFVSKKTGFSVYADPSTSGEQIMVGRDYTMSKAGFMALSANVTELFVNAMDGAIQSTIGESVNNSVGLIRDMTQIQSIILGNAYSKRVEAVMPKPGTEGYVQGGGLSKKQQDEVFNSLMPLNPFVTGNNQVYYIANSEKVDTANPTPLGASLNNKVSARPMVSAPGNAGVKGIATMVIGSGDGKTIQLASQDQTNTERATFIFDGINFPLDFIREGSQAANKAALEAILGNPMENVLASFDAMITELTEKAEAYLDMNDTFRLEMATAMVGKDSAPDVAPDLTAEDIMKYMSALSKEASRAAMWIDARHNTMKRVNLSMDQMAAAGAPHHVTDQTPVAGSFTEVATQMNAIMAEELTKAREKFDVQLDAVGTARRNKKVSVAPELENFAPNEAGVRIVQGDALKGLLSGLVTSLPKTQATIVEAAIRNLTAEGYKIVAGDFDQLSVYNETLGGNAIDMSSVDPINDRGLTNPHSREIWLLNPSAETLVHEVIHASTFMSLLSHYNGEKAVSSQVSESIDAIEGLMNQFLNLNKADLLPYGDAVAAIRGALNNTKLSEAERKAQAVNEYMAWGLANRDLATAQSKVPVSITTLVWDTVKAIRDFLFGKTKSNTDDMLSNLVFHTKVVMGETQPTLSTVSETVSLMMSTNAKDTRMEKLNRMIQKKVGQYVSSGSRTAQAQAKTVVTKGSINGNAVRALFAANGFPMTMEESATFHKIVAVLGTQAQLDSVVMSRLQEIYGAVMKELTVESFMDDPQSNNPNDFAVAQQRYDVLVGKKGFGKDTMGRTTLLPSFMALALTNDRFRKVLAEMPVPRTDKSDRSRTVDAWLENTANALLDRMTDLVTGQKSAPNVQVAIDAMADQLLTADTQAANYYGQVIEASGSMIDRANDRVVKGMSQLGEKLGKTAEARRAAGKGQTLTDQLVNNGLELASSILSEERASLVAEATMAGINSSNLPKWLHDLLVDMIGRVDSNANVYDLIKKVRSGIQRVRNQFRTELPQTLAKQFSRRVTKDEWSMMHNVIGRTDAAALTSAGWFSRADVLDLMSNQTALNKAINQMETEVTQMAGRNGNEMLSRSAQLANFMMTGIPGQNLARNANAIARRLGMRNPDQTLDKALAERIDTLVSLYALDQVSTKDKAAMATLIREESAGVQFVYDYAKAMSDDEISREKQSLMGQASYNRYKGHMPQLAQDGVSLILAPNTEYSDLVQRSYVRVAGYAPSSLDPTAPSMSYFYAPVSGRASFNQGIIQNIRQTVGGVDNLTGYTVGGVTAGRITDNAKVRKIAALQAAGRYVEGGSNLMPVFSSVGTVVAYERAADPAITASLNYNTNYAEVIGAWKGRLAEEMLGNQSNDVAVEQLANMYREDMKKSSLNKSQYVNVFDLKTQDKYPVLVDALKLFTPHTVDLIHSHFPQGEFWVRRDMLDNVVGYRSATVGDVWTGNSYWSKQTQETVRKLALTVFGNKAFQLMVNAESTLQGVVQDARTLIVVKSVVVPMANFMSNVFQLVARGVPLRAIVAGLPKKLAEVRQYTASEKRAIEAEAELHATTDPIKQRRLAVEIRTLRDSFKRMSIYPLIERGELSSMSDDSVPEDAELTAGRLTQFIEAQVNKLPPAIRTAGKYALITKDTALYKGLRKSVEYGDFLAKAIMWDDMVTRQGKTAEYAGSKITEEFVNYDRLGGRNRQYLEDIGLLWFYNFKIRSAKVALSMMRNNPVHTLLAGVAAPAGMGIGSPISDNLVSKLFEGSLDNSIGLDQLLAAPMIHPLENIVF